MTNEGVTALIMNSPNLLTFQAFLWGYSADDFYFEQDLRRKLSDRKLFKYCGYQVGEVHRTLALEYFWQPLGELVSFWH